MINFICPVCRRPLIDEGRLYRCENNHSFDKSKYGYVNLLQSNQSSSKRHGDDRLMIRARRDFLSKGRYSFLLDELIRVCDEYLKQDAAVIDAGCGECYYSTGLADAFGGYSLTGADISKDALEFAGKRGARFPLCVASLFDLPFDDNSADCILNCFAPDANAEFFRVLKEGGILIKVVPLEEHLFSLKEAIYEKPYLNEAPKKSERGFELIDFIEKRAELTVSSHEDISNLFRMTPYYYKTGREDQQKAESLEKITTCAAFGILVFKKGKEYE